MSDGQGEVASQEQNNSTATVNASDAANTTDDASKDSVYAANRALYESSLAGQQQQSNLPNFDFQGGSQQHQSNGEAVGSSGIANGAADAASAGEAGQTGKRRLIRAGDMEASKNGSAETSGNQGGADGTAQQPPQPESMRDKIRAARGGSVGSGQGGSPAASAFSPAASTGNPFVAQPQYANGNGQVMSELEKMIDTNARAFSSKNPHVPPDKVRQALQHSKGAFDATFSTALKILLGTGQNGQQSATPAGSPPAFSPQNSTSSLPGGQPQAYQPSMRYPGQNTAPQQSPPYPGSAAYQNMSQSQDASQQPGASPINPNAPLHPHQMAGPPGSAANPNGLTAANLGGTSPFNNQMLAGPPPPVLPGTHPSIGFSALQILPQEQHQQFLQLAPNQQTDYSMQVYQALSQEQQKQYAALAQNQQRIRDAWNRQQQSSGSMMMIPPGSRPGASGASANPYIGYASHNPTQQQQAMQQRFPGQNPVFRVGAPQAGATMQGGSQQPSQADVTRQQHYLQEQHRILLAQLSPPERAQVLALPVQQQQQWVIMQVNQRAEHQKRQAAQHHRTQQQQMMAQKHQEHKQKMSGAAATPIAAPSGKKRRRKNYSDSDEEDLNLHDDSSDNDNDDDDDVDAGDGSEAEAERESKAIEWFNTTSTQELMEMTGI